MPFEPSRRSVIGYGASALATAALRHHPTVKSSRREFVSILRTPDFARAIVGADESHALSRHGEEWSGAGVSLKVIADHQSLTVLLSSDAQATRVQLRWHGDLKDVTHYLGDDWERSYADLQWQGEFADRIMPWYFLAHDGHRTDGYGVKTGANAFCFWSADSQGISLWIDFRSGGAPVQLGGRTLEAAVIVQKEGAENESPFQVQQALCRLMCPSPLLPSEPIFGTNDWNYAYGNNSADLIYRVSSLISELSHGDQRPFSVIDEGWAMGPYNGNFGHGPWFGNPRFGDMGAFATRLKSAGVRPGIWFRPLTPLPETPKSWKLPRDQSFLDPTVPEVKQHVAEHIRRFVDWGYEMVKHDFTTFDVTGRWGFQMRANPTQDGWSFQDKSKTTAEVLKELYRTIRTAAGSAKLIGCNTVGHLTAGTHEVQRIGDDTSGRSWNRNRRMGVNTLAFRLAQNRQFFVADPDIVAITKQIPWELVRQWMELVSRSSTALFIAIDPELVDAKLKSAVSAAITATTSKAQLAEPLDWLHSTCPREWTLSGQRQSFAWMGPEGAIPFGDN